MREIPIVVFKKSIWVCEKYYLETNIFWGYFPSTDLPLLETEEVAKEPLLDAGVQGVWSSAVQAREEAKWLPPPPGGRRRSDPPESWKSVMLPLVCLGRPTRTKNLWRPVLVHTNSLGLLYPMLEKYLKWRLWLFCISRSDLIRLFYARYCHGNRPTANSKLMD